MKDHLAALVRQARSPAQGRNVAREYLQAQILAALQRAGAMIPLAFQGGTALRFLYGIPRYSEDLYFALEQRRERYDLRAYVRMIAAGLRRNGYAVECKLSDRRTVHSAFVRFPGLLYDLGLSTRRQEVVAVKIEVDTRPPQGARLEITLVRRHELLRLQHHDQASLLAGKVHALLSRPYLKGRDVFDLIWYLADPGWPEPNLAMLNAALAQTGYPGAALTRRSWKRAVAHRVTALDPAQVTDDVRPFLDTPDEAPTAVEDLLRLLR